MQIIKKTFLYNSSNRMLNEGIKLVLQNEMSLKQTKTIGLNFKGGKSLKETSRLLSGFQHCDKVILYEQDGLIELKNIFEFAEGYKSLNELLERFPNFVLNLKDLDLLKVLRKMLANNDIKLITGTNVSDSCDGDYIIYPTSIFDYYHVSDLIGAGKKVVLVHDDRDNINKGLLYALDRTNTIYSDNLIISTTDPNSVRRIIKNNK